MKSNRNSGSGGAKNDQAKFLQNGEMVDLENCSNEQVDIELIRFGYDIDALETRLENDLKKLIDRIEEDLAQSKKTINGAKSDTYFQDSAGK